MNDTTAQDLMLLLANPKKLQRANSVATISQTDTLQPVKTAFQILEAKCIKDITVQTYPREFAEFLNRNNQEIIAAFSRSLSRT